MGRKGFRICVSIAMVGLCQCETEPISDSTITAGNPLSSNQTCRPEPVNIQAQSGESTLFAAMRKDAFLPRSNYAENLPDPNEGGRIHIAAIAKISGRVTAAYIDSTNLHDALKDKTLHWYHIWPKTLTAGKPVTVSFHARTGRWDSANQLQLKIETDHGIAVDGSTQISRSETQFTYITTAFKGNQVIMHLRNGPVERTLKRLLFNGVDVTTKACIPNQTLAPRHHALFTLDLTHQLALGSAYTAVAEWKEDLPSVAVGRILPEFFPIEAWGKTEECALPNTGNGTWQNNFEQHIQHGIDTFFVRPDYADKCYGDGDRQRHLEEFANSGNWSILDEGDFGPVSHTEHHVAARMLADEVDQGDDPWERTQEKVQQGWQRLEEAPDIPTYIGGSRNRNLGKFAGIADIQGVDYYVAACAPHVTEFDSGLNLRGPYDYARMARLNHMPLPTWVYTQGFSSGWNADRPIFGLRIRQPRQNEMLVQAGSVLASGAKGIMWYQTELGEAHRNQHTESTWENIAIFNETVRLVREFLRKSDPTSMVRVSDPDVIAETLRSPEAIVVPVINTKSSHTPSDLSCALWNDEHWKIEDVTINLDIDIPEDFSVVDLFTVQGKSIEPITPKFSNRTLQVEDFHLRGDRPFALIVVAGHPRVRDIIGQSASSDVLPHDPRDEKEKAQTPSESDAASYWVDCLNTEDCSVSCDTDYAIRAIAVNFSMMSSRRGNLQVLCEKRQNQDQTFVHTKTRHLFEIDCEYCSLACEANEIVRTVAINFHGADRGFGNFETTCASGGNGKWEYRSVSTEHLSCQTQEFCAISCSGQNVITALSINFRGTHNNNRGNLEVYCSDMQ